ncbi:MAG: hypothetical protein ACLR8P_09870 [Clostridium fessum]
MPLMKAITELGSEDDDTLAFSRSQMEEYLREAADTNLIHQGEAAVLPGFLVMNACLLRLWKKGLDEGTRPLWKYVFLPHFVLMRSISVGFGAGGKKRGVSENEARGKGNSFDYRKIGMPMIKWVQRSYGCICKPFIKTRLTIL